MGFGELMESQFGRQPRQVVEGRVRGSEGLSLEKGEAGKREGCVQSQES